MGVHKLTLRSGSVGGVAVAASLFARLGSVILLRLKLRQKAVVGLLQISQPGIVLGASLCVKVSVVVRLSKEGVITKRDWERRTFSIGS